MIFDKTRPYLAQIPVDDRPGVIVEVGLDLNAVLDQRRRDRKAHVFFALAEKKLRILTPERKAAKVRGPQRRSSEQDSGLHRCDTEMQGAHADLVLLGLF
jgi:hypothetical protein